MKEDRARWTDLIATSLQVSGLSEEELERKLGWSPGSLGQLLEGEGDLEPDQVLEILGELNEGSRPKRNEAAANARGRTQMVTELLERFGLLGYEPREAAPAPAPSAKPSSLKELEEKVESVLRKAYGEPPAETPGRKTRDES
jgi:hypothetical protein